MMSEPRKVLDWWQCGNVDGDDVVDLSEYNWLKTNFRSMDYDTAAGSEPGLEPAIPLLVACLRGDGTGEQRRKNKQRR
jgi:hypothetical protein